MKVEHKYETVDVECRGCGTPFAIPKKDSITDMDLPAKFKMCEKCLMAGLLWGLERWLEAGAPGAERKQ